MFSALSYKEIGQKKKFDDKFLTICGSLYFISNGIGRVVWGVICEKLLFKKTFFFISIGQVNFYFNFALILM
jgi:hypothetical protein